MKRSLLGFSAGHTNLKVKMYVSNWPPRPRRSRCSTSRWMREAPRHREPFGALTRSLRREVSSPLERIDTISAQPITRSVRRSLKSS